jgi:aspartyl-tRNA(Asn)/glutamyl-tRNA(Gln) amidotransferase subunit A
MAGMIVARTEAQVALAEKLNKELNAFITIDGQGALNRARELEDSPKKTGPLFGKLIGVKDNISVAGLKCTASSRTLENYVAPYTATGVERLLEAGAILLGKTNMDEFAAGGAGISGSYGPVKNPLSLGRVPGGSSSGSAAAVAAGIVDLAIGTDTGGSIRAPAAFCGLCGFRPSWGAVSRHGLADLCMSMDTISPIGKSPGDLIAAFGAMRGKDDRDQTSLDFPRKVRGRKPILGVPKEFFEGEIDSGVLETILSAIDRLGLETEKVSIPSSKYAVPIYYLTLFAEFSSAMQKYDGLKYGLAKESVSKTRSLAFGPEVKRRVLLGTYITLKEHKSKWLDSASRARRVLAREVDNAFSKNEVDFLVGPTMPCLPWVFGEKKDPLQNYLADVLTVQASLCGIPAGSVPAGSVDSLPSGFQIHGRRGHDDEVLEFMQFAYEKFGKRAQDELKLDGRLFS